MSAAPESMVGQWLVKADHDYGSAHDLIEFSSDCAYDVVCFLCQQCVEKYLKAMLVLNGLDVPRTHDLTQIFAAIPSRGSLAIEIDELANLTPYAVEMRYPGHWLMETREEATKAFEVATRIRDLLKPLLQP